MNKVLSSSVDDECKDKEEAEQAVTDNICRQIDRNFTLIHGILNSLQSPIPLLDAYSELCKLYSIAVAVPVSSCTAERSFSALKRVSDLPWCKKG